MRGLRLRSRSSPLMLSRRVQKGHRHGRPRYSQGRGRGASARNSPSPPAPRCVLAHKLHPTSQPEPKPDRCPSQAKRPDGGEKKSNVSWWTRQLFSSERERESITQSSLCLSTCSEKTMCTCAIWDQGCRDI